MKRRQVVGGVLGAGLFGGGAWVAANGLGETTGLPVTVETLDARGSEAGELRVPTPGVVTVVDLFATWCVPCKRQMDALATVQAEFGADVRFVSVTNERFGDTLNEADVRDWWREHDGHWTLGHDPESQLASALGAGNIPYVAVARPDGDIAWSHAGVTGPDALREQIEAARR